VMQTQLGTGNHTIWVRAVSSEGISYPVTVPLNIGESIELDKEDSPSLPFSMVVFASLIVAVFRSKRT